MSVPVKLFYGSHDWAKESDKFETQNLLKLDRFETINESNHFSFLENTMEVSGSLNFNQQINFKKG